MSLTAYQLELRRCISAGNTLRLQQLLSTESQELQKINPLGSREIDYLLSYIIIHNNDESQQIALCRLLFEAGADPNKSEYQQSDVGYVHDAAERSLALVKLFVERGAHINHEICGQPACWAMISAAMAGKLDIVKYLVEQGGVVNFVNIRGSSPLDFARDPEVREYLLSIGAKSGSDLPKDHLPPPEPEEPEQRFETFREFLEEHKHQGPVTNHSELETMLGNLVRHVWQFETSWGNALITEGLFDIPANVPNDDPTGVRRAELAVIPWTITESGEKETNYQNLYEWFVQVVRYPMESGSYFRKVNVISNEDPPKPLWPGTEYTGLLILSQVGRNAWGKWERPDGEVVEVLMMTPLFTEEIEMERQYGQEEFLRRLYKGWALDYFDLIRDNVTNPSPPPNNEIFEE